MLHPELPTLEDPPLDPADMCETVARLIFHGLPRPISVHLAGRPRVLVLPDVLDEWVAATYATPGTWQLGADVAYEHYRAQASGFDIVTNRPYVGKHTS